VPHLAGQPCPLRAVPALPGDPHRPARQAEPVQVQHGLVTHVDHPQPGLLVHAGRGRAAAHYRGDPALSRRLRQERGDHSLEFLAGMPALQARDWLTSIGGIGKKTASIILLFCCGMPLMPVDRHVERVSKRIGLLPAKATADQAHDYYLAILRPDQMLEAHVNLIRHGRVVCHARNPEHDRCPVAARCRFVDPKAP